MKPVLVAGGGPAGLAAAIQAATEGAKVVLFEKNPSCGKKLLLTGGGRANLGNLSPMSEWPSLFGKRGRFIVSALEFLPTPKYRAWLAALGVDTAAADGFHLFPTADSAAYVLEKLLRRATALGVRICSGQPVERLAFTADNRLDGAVVDGQTLAALAVVDGKTVAALAVVVACGGKSFPATGSAGDGYALAEQAGHRVRTAVPALVGLHVEAWNPELAGLVLENAGTTLHAKGFPPLRDARELLLTHHGFSGPAILDLSGTATEAMTKQNGEVVLAVNWQNNMNRESWREKLDAWRARSGNKKVERLLGERFPRKLAEWLCRLANVPAAATASSLAARARDDLASTLADSHFKITGSDGWQKAMVTRGGIETTKIDPKTLQSKITPNLHFAGETLDVDGPCGGYNLHWAFASGALAGASASHANPDAGRRMGTE